jgi:hypothetical protein
MAIETDMYMVASMYTVTDHGYGHAYWIWTLTVHIRNFHICMCCHNIIV